jgi:hypothetical protein
VKQAFLSSLSLGFLLLVAAVPTMYAQAPVGIRAGVSANPDQFFIGGHVQLGPIADRVWFRPNIEAGFGNDHTLVGTNFEFTYWIPLKRQWEVYFGGGPALVVSSFNSPRGGRDWNAGPGLNMLIGLAQRRGLMTEIKVGALDSPDVKFTIGWTF